MKSFLAKLKREEKGAVMVMMAFGLVAMFGFAAFAVDFGLAYNQKADLQNAADAAALAGAQRLPNYANAVEAAYTIAEANGCPRSQTTVTAPYSGDISLIEVVCTGTVDYYFAQVLGIESVLTSERAVAKNQAQWDGDALPFVNLDDDYSIDSEIVAWEKTAPGDFESLDNDDYEIINPDDPETCYFEVDYQDGLIITEGTVATVKQEIGYIYERVQPDIPVYALSLSTEVINRGYVELTDGTIRYLPDLKNGDDLKPDQLVLLECLFTYYDYNAKTIFLTVLNVYDIMNGELPPDYVPPDGGQPKIVE